MDKQIYKIVAILIIAALVIGVVLVLIPQKRGVKQGGAEFVIQKGQSLNVVARSLAEQDLIISRYLFVAYAVLSGHEKDFKAGRYKIAESASTAGLVKMFSRGLSEPEDIAVTILEGSNAADIDKILVEVGLVRSGEFLSTALPYEGYLFPDTYRLHNSQFPIPNFQTNPNNQQPTEEVQPQEFQEIKPLDLQEIIEKMRRNFETKTEGMFKYLSIEEKKKIIIIASMLEKEVRTEQDMRLVAGIIEKRLELGMPLEIDAAVAYGVCRPKFLLGGYCDVSLANIVDNIPVDSAYNTYKRKGLPYSPISNPGLKAIKAVLNLQPSDYLYYLSAKDGMTIFSKTAEEHMRARHKYLK